MSGDWSVGGMVGIMEGGEIRESYAVSEVSEEYGVGGMVGDMREGEIRESYAVSEVSGVSGIGGIVGEKYSSTIRESYYDEEVAGVSDTGKGEPKTTASMKNPIRNEGIYSNWSGTVWDYRGETQYPRIRSLRKTEPLKIRKIKIKKINEQRIKIEWEEPYDGGEEIEGYEIIIKGGTFIGEIGTIIGKENKEKEIKIEKGIEYEIGVRGYNKIGKGIIKNKEYRMVNLEGLGTKESPYEIGTVGDLKEMRYQINKNGIENETYELIRDIEFTEQDYENELLGWEPIGNRGNSFEGTIDGKGYKIKNVEINRPTENYIGLFGYVKGGRISNLGIEGGTVKGKMVM